MGCLEMAPLDILTGLNESHMAKLKLQTSKIRSQLLDSYSIYSMKQWELETFYAYT